MQQAVFLYPGQGSQYVGMGKSLHNSYASVRTLFDEAADVLRLDLRELCFSGPAEALAQTENVQPAITLVNLAVLQALREDGVEPNLAAGHSLGEYAALCTAGVFSFAAAIELVRFRGEAMRDAARANAGGMVAVFGLSGSDMQELCNEARSAGIVEIANVNSPSQVVLSGEENAITEAGRLAKIRGAKLVVRLKVTGPWHSSLMNPAREKLRGKLAEIAFGNPSFPVYCNVTGALYASDSATIREALVEQLVSPVQWNRIMADVVAGGDRLLLEAGPGKVLTGLFKEAHRGVRVHNIQDADALEQLRQFRTRNRDD